MDEPNRILYLQTEIEDNQPLEVIQQIHAINRFDQNKVMVEPITLHLTTFGGFITTGLAVCDAIRTSQTPIHIIASGRCMSIGVSILASGHMRSATRSTSFMIHQGSSPMEGYLEHLKTEVKYVESINQLSDDIIIENTKITQKQLLAIYKKGAEFNFGCDKALKWNLIQEIL